MSADFAIADTCFLIDWASWRRRDVLFRLFKTVFVPELVLREVRSERTIEWIASSLSSGSLSLFTETPDVIALARSLVEKSKFFPIRGVDLPEAICLAVGKMRGYTVITENRGALMAADILEELSGVKVWRSLELIAEVLRRGLIKERKVFAEYEMDTGHRFPRRDLEAVLHELGGED
ncbi:MAG: DNA-binding protein [Candidatus Methanodesulfokora sp.]